MNQQDRRRVELRLRVVSGFQRELAARYRFARPYAAGARVLVLGCREGWGLAALLETAGEVVALDPLPQAVRRAARRFARPSIRFAVGGPMVEMLAPAAFDLVTAFSRLDRVNNWPAFLDSVVRVLRPGGRVLLAVANAGWWPGNRLAEAIPLADPLLALGEFHDLLADRLVIEGLYGQSSAGRVLLTYTAPALPPVPRGTLDLADRAAAVAGPPRPQSRYFIAVGRR
ncbi:MAG: class I SAM-dependent methyltransferase [Chloroflexi bacterium]|nr:class I SAM-dependent methyltransferase [Chloroflexota bacterium]